MSEPSQRPVLLVVSRSAAVRDLLSSELARRYDRDYQVVPAPRRRRLR